MNILDIETDQNNEFAVAGIACTSASLENLKTLSRSLPLEIAISFIVFQDLAQSQQGNLTQLLEETSSLPVHEIVNTAQLEPGHLYVVPENNFLILESGTLKLKRFTREEKASESLDKFFATLADKFNTAAIGILLCWPASGGVWGLKKIREKGGSAIAISTLGQNVFLPSDSASSSIDYFTRPALAADLLTAISTALAAVHDQSHQAQQTFRNITRLTALKTGTALEHFNLGILQRKTAKRMVLTGKNSLSSYLALLKGSLYEQDLLFYEILNSPAFLLSSPAFDMLRQKAFPKLLEKSSRKELRFWCLGCRTGEEAYSLAIVADEYLQASHRNDLSIKILATDLSLRNIEKARTGIYSQQDLKHLTQERIDRYFIRKGDSWHAGRIIRDCCVFAVHDITKDFPFSGIDLISCRIAMRLFGSELQQRLAASFHYALRPEGFLLLGEGDSIPLAEELFEALESQDLYQRKNISRSIRASSLPKIPDEELAPPIYPESKSESKHVKDLKKIAEELLEEQYALAAVLINEHYEIIHSSGDTSPFLHATASKPNANILDMVHSEIRPILKNAILAARAEKRSQLHNGSPTISHNSPSISFEVLCLPLHCELLLITFNREILPHCEEQPKESIKKKEKQHPQIDLGQLSEKQRLYFEELQATNMELQKRSHELEFLYLQLEATAEELRSNNEELSCTSAELQGRHNELSSLQRLHALVTSGLREPLLILDGSFTVQSANPAFYSYFSIKEGKFEGFSIFEHAGIQWMSSEFKNLVLQRISLGEMVKDISVTFGARKTLRTFLVSSSASETDGQRLIAIIFRDTTDLTEAKNKLSSTKIQQLDRSRKLEQFTASATDRLLDPVRKIQMFGRKITGSENGLTQQGHSSMERLLKTSLNLEKLIEDLIAYSRVHFEPKKLKKTDLNQVLRKVLAELKNPIRESHATIEHDELPHLHVIPCQIRLLFSHLIANALSFANESSAPVVKIRLRHAQNISHEIAGADPETEYVRLSFTDNGQGFDQNYQDLVFDPFYKLHRNEKQYGAGLGLTMVQQIVLNHRGLIKISSSSGQGTEVHIYLPAPIF